MYPVDTIKTRMQMGVPALAGGGGLALFKVPFSTMTDRPIDRPIDRHIPYTDH